MNKSDSIKELATSLCKVQAELQTAKKGSTNPFFHSKYADLLSVWDACRGSLAPNGLSVVQTADFIENDQRLVLETTLLHESGEWISGRLAIPLVKNDPQAMGSAMTYGRRYSLAAIIGLCTEEDDDAEKGMKRESAKTPQPTQKQPDVRQSGTVEGIKDDIILAPAFPLLNKQYGVNLEKCWEHGDEWKIYKNGGRYHKMPDGSFCNFSKLLPIGEVPRLKFKTSVEFKAWLMESTGKEWIKMNEIEQAGVLESILEGVNGDRP